ncbi:MAG: hypothetical protein ACRC6G_05905 [Deefgea sp.]
MPDYLPSKDAEFDSWQQRFVTLAESKLGQNVKALAPQLVAARAAFEAAYGQHIAAQAAAKAATVAKAAARGRLVPLLRTAAQIVQIDPSLSDEQRAAAGLPVHKKSRTRAKAPTTRPLVEIEAGQRLRHTLHFRDEGSTRKARPVGVQGAEIWVKLGNTPPASTDELRFLALDTSSPYTCHFDIPDAGQTAYYMLRWLSTNGKPGPWSETVSATVGG